MTRLEQLEQQVTSLSPDELAKFERWFQEYLEDAWDQQIEEDIRAGKLDHIAEQVRRDVKAGDYTEL